MILISIVVVCTILDADWVLTAHFEASLCRVASDKEEGEAKKMGVVVYKRWCE